MGIVLAFLGIVNASYLLYAHRKPAALVCPLDHDCSVVTESRWSRVLGVRNEVLGILFYLGVLSLFIASIVLPGTRLITTLILAATAGGALYSAALIGIQAFVIKDYCFYCIISALLSVLLLIDALLL